MLDYEKQIILTASDDQADSEMGSSYQIPLLPSVHLWQQILAQHRSHTDPHHLLSDPSPEGLHRDTRDKGKVKEGLTTKEGSLSLTCNEEQHTEISCVVSALCSEDGSLETTAHTVERVGEMLYTKLCQCLSRPTYSTSGISFNKHTVTS